MRQQRLVLFCLLLFAGLSACSPGHTGANELAFLRDGQLWTVDPDGANAFEVAGGAPPVVSYGWSPTHQLLAYRSLDPSFAATPAARRISTQPLTQLVGDLPATINTISIDGGTPIPIQFSSASVQNSNAWWNATGTRLLYREESVHSSSMPSAALWWISQNDQPGGIARKALPATFSIPAVSADDSLVVGNSRQGLFTTTLAGTSLRYLVAHELAGHPLGAGLERLLWQPAHPQPLLLYALMDAPAGQSAGFDAPSPAVRLVLRDMHGHVTIVTGCSCTQFAWSPDGNSILYSNGSSYTIFRLADHSALNLPVAGGSVPYWSPDSQFLLLDALHSLTLIHVAGHRLEILLSDGVQGGMLPGRGTGINELLQPLANSPWSSDSRNFLFLTRGRPLWQGHALHPASGLYTVTIDDMGRPQGSPVLVDSGNDSQPGWTYEDPSTSFLY
jgi:hypothetical protein